MKNQKLIKTLAAANLVIAAGCIANVGTAKESRACAQPGLSDMRPVTVDEIDFSPQHDGGCSNQGCNNFGC